MSQNQPLFDSLLSNNLENYQSRSQLLSNIQYCKTNPSSFVEDQSSQPQNIYLIAINRIEVKVRSRGCYTLTVWLELFLWSMCFIAALFYWIRTGNYHYGTFVVVTITGLTMGSGCVLAILAKRSFDYKRQSIVTVVLVIGMILAMISIILSGIYVVYTLQINYSCASTDADCVIAYGIESIVTLVVTGIAVIFQIIFSGVLISISIILTGLFKERSELVIKMRNSQNRQEV